MGDAIHFLPRFILREFKGDSGLLALDKLTGICEPRNVRIAGQREDFWPPGIEHGLMELMDDRASKILQKMAYRRKSISLCPDQRQTLSEWFGLWIIRAPRNLERHKLELAEAAKDPNLGETLLLENPHGAIEAFRTKNPGLYRKTVSRWGGHALARGYIFQRLVKNIRAKGSLRLPQAQETFEHHVGSNTHTDFAPIFNKMTWSWLTCSNHDFVIGDDPVCRFGTAQHRWEYGISHSDVEVTIPLARDLCVLLTHHGTETPQVIDAPAEQALRCNRRQIDSALQHVYGPTQIALRPDDEAAAYGF